MKTLLSALLLAALATSAAHATTISVSFDQPNQTGVAGQTLQFFGTITNIGASTVYLNSDDPNFSPFFTVTDQFFSTVPPSLDPGTNSGDIELFDITLNSPFLGSTSPYAGIYDLVGGADGNAQDVLTSANFSVALAAPATSPVPEPASIALLLTGLSALVPISRRVRDRA